MLFNNPCPGPVVQGAFFRTFHRTPESADTPAFSLCPAVVGCLWTWQPRRPFLPRISHPQSATMDSQSRRGAGGPPPASRQHPAATRSVRWRLFLLTPRPVTAAGYHGTARGGCPRGHNVAMFVWPAPSFRGCSCSLPIRRNLNPTSGCRSNAGSPNCSTAGLRRRTRKTHGSQNTGR